MTQIEQSLQAEKGIRSKDCLLEESCIGQKQPGSRGLATYAQSLTGDRKRRACHLLKSCGGYRRCCNQGLPTKCVTTLCILLEGDPRAHLQVATRINCDCYFALLFVSSVAFQFTGRGRLNRCPPVGVQILISRICKCVHKLKGLCRCE